MSENHNCALIGGILSIVSGAIGIITGLTLAGVGVFFYLMMTGIINIAEKEPMPEFMGWIFLVIYGLLGFFLILLGVLAIIGGAYSIKKKYWGLVLAGAIAGTMVFFYTGIAGVILVSLGRSEFRTAKPAVSSAETSLEACPPAATP
jgi:hypothetical protein